MQKHIYVEQKGIEEISREDLNSLAILTNLNLDETSDLKGTVHTKNFLETLKTKLISKFPDFHINIDEPIIIDKTRKDSIEQKDTDAVLIDILYSQNLSQSNTYMTKVEAQNISNNQIGIRGRQKSIFQDNDNIINFEAFQYFTNITELNGYCDNNAQKVGIFKECNNLKKIELPETLITIYTTAFDNCRSLQKIDLKNVINIEDGGNWQNVGESGSFYGCISLQEVIWPNVTKIGTYAFKNCSKLALDTLPSNLKTLGNGAFSGTLCNFKNLPESVTTINGFPWVNTTGTQTYPLYNSTIVSWGGYYTSSNNLTNTIINNTLINTDGLGNIILKKSQKIGQSAFEDNINLKTIEGCGPIIESYAFKGCSSLINVKGTTSSIGNSTNVFQNSGLIEITDDIWNLFGTSIPRNTFINSKLKGKIIIPEKITTIESNSDFPFNGTKIKELVLPSNLSILASGNAPLNIPRIRKINTNNIIHIAQDMFYNTPCLKFLQFDKVPNISGYQRYGNNCGIKYIYLNFNSVCPWWGTSYFGIPTFTKFCVPVGMKSKYLEDNNWKNIPDRIIEVTSQEIEQLKKDYYGVDFFGDKYYDTKRRILQTSKFILEAEYFGGGSGRIFGISTNSQGYGGYWPRAEFTNSFSWFATYTGNISISSYTKHHIEFSKDSITVNGNTILSNRIDSYNYETTAYLGALNYNNTAISKWQGTIYKFLWYEGDTLVQAWIGNENGGFDIYADEDIEPQENDTINSLEMYAIRYQQQ